MKFTDPAFFCFLLIVLILYPIIQRHYWTMITLMLAASLYFYSYHGELRLLLILSYCVINWWVGLHIQRSIRPRLVLGFGVGFNIAALCFFKYTPMLVLTFVDMLSWVGINAQLPNDMFFEWSIPFGLSFYAFTGIAYMVDVYRNQAQPEQKLMRFSLYMSFFPQLMAGPILRPREFLTKLKPDIMRTLSKEFSEGVYLIGRGMFKKMVLADRIAITIDPFFTHVGNLNTAGVWALPYIYLYALQIFFDFSGYTDMARGMGLLFGFRWPENFRYPYLALSIQDFWHRWHITLSKFLRDYLFIPLGGSKSGRLRTYVNIMITMLIGGIWHGASWSFMLWGGFHGLLLVAYRIWKETILSQYMSSLHGIPSMLWKVFSWFITFHCVCVMWSFFRLTSFPDSLACVRKLVIFDMDKILVGGAENASLWLLLMAYGLFVATAYFIGQKVTVWQEQCTIPNAVNTIRGFTWGTTAMLLVLTFVLSPGGEAPAFIYFQF